MFSEVIFNLSHHPVVCAFSKWQASTPAPVIAAYATCLVVAGSVYHFIAGAAFSSVITMSAIVQCLGVSILCIQVLTSRSAAGISAEALKLDAASIAFRLSSTVWLNGYLPVDASGDFAYQLIDACSLFVVLWLLYLVLVTHRSTYQAEVDAFRASKAVMGCFVLAMLLHADEDRRPIYDTFWMTGLFTGVLAVLPQLWLSSTGGHMEALTSHYIAALALSRVLSGMFMWAARNSINCRPWVGGINHAVVAIFGAHVLHLLLLGDFAFIYMRSALGQGLGASLDLGSFV
jgi:ER lumen protein retaining receptor